MNIQALHFVLDIDGNGERSLLEVHRMIRHGGPRRLVKRTIRHPITQKEIQELPQIHAGAEQAAKARSAQLKSEAEQRAKERAAERAARAAAAEAARVAAAEARAEARKLARAARLAQKGRRVPLSLEQLEAIRAGSTAVGEG